MQRARLFARPFRRGGSHVSKDTTGKDTEEQGKKPSKGMKIRMTRTKPTVGKPFFTWVWDWIKALPLRTKGIIAGALVLVIAAAFIMPPLLKGNADKRQDDAYTLVHATPKPTPTPEPKEPPVIDLSAVAQTVPLESGMNRINEPTPWEEELLYSAGQSSGIDEMIFTKLYTYNMNTKEETEQAESEIKNKSGLPGEHVER